MNNLLSRRKFLLHTCQAIGATTFYSSALNLAATSAFAADNNSDYRALVCILLAGGNDSFNLLVPNDTDGYANYQATRADLALKQKDLLAIQSASGNDTRPYGLHPATTGMQKLFNRGELSFIANVGTLVQPINDYKNWEQSKLPLGLFSHSDQIAHWQTALPNQRTALGWGGRMADLLDEMNNNTAVSMNISLSGSNIFQTGNSVQDYSINPNGTAENIEGYGGSEDWMQLLTQAVDSPLALKYQNIFARSYAKSTRQAIDTNIAFNQLIKTAAQPKTQFSNSEFSQSLSGIARTIAARELLGMKRQTFFLVFDGWDHHDELLNNQQQMLSVLSQGLNEFRDSLVELGVFNQVTTFSISDFARTLTSNGRGSDHGWGGNQFIMGGNVNGKNIYGNYPDLSLGNPLDTGRGRLIPTTSTDQYFAELALWFGVTPSDLSDILPNIGEFYSYTSNVAPLGFMQS